MGKPNGFLEYPRESPARRPVEHRIQDWREIYHDFPASQVQTQAARCMDCGVPFCNSGCPLNNLIPDWNDLVYKDRWRDAIVSLHATNNFPEFTGRICPAPCEASCVLGINEKPVSIKAIECAIVDHAFAEGWIRPQPALRKSGKRIAIAGSGPAGLAAAQQLARAGHAVAVFEKSDRLGGLLRYGIPDFKMEKRWIDRRIDQMRAEGVEFVTKVNVGDTLSVDDLKSDYHAVLIAMGAEQPRDLPVPGRALSGIHFAMDYLTQQNRRGAGDAEAAAPILAGGKRVVILGGGDTGADCLGTSHRQKAASVHQFEILATPPSERDASTPWPMWPHQLRTESSHEEGGERNWAVRTTRFSGENGHISKLHYVRAGDSAGTEHTLDADLVLLAMGFMGPSKRGLVEQLNLTLDARGNIAAPDCQSPFQTSVTGVFAAGDARRGQSLVVWAIAEGRQAATAIDRYLAAL